MRSVKFGLPRDGTAPGILPFEPSGRQVCLEGPRPRRAYISVTSTPTFAIEMNAQGLLSPSVEYALINSVVEVEVVGR